MCNQTERAITSISLAVASMICSGPKFELLHFAENGNCNHVLLFSHYNFFYTYPVWGTKWKNGKDCQFHRLHTKCHLCDYTPERNYAGIGNIYLLNNGISDAEILVKTGESIKRGRIITHTQYVPNTPRLSRMVLLCPTHAKQYFNYKKEPILKEENGQLCLF